MRISAEEQKRFGAIIRKEREHRKMNKEQFAMFVGVSRATIRTAEINAHRSKHSTVFQVLRKLNVPLEAVYFEDATWERFTFTDEYLLNFFPECPEKKTLWQRVKGWIKIVLRIEA